MSSMGANTHFTPGRGSFLPRDAFRLLNQLRIETARAGNGNWKSSAITVDHVVAKQDWNLEPRLFQRNFLQSIGVRSAQHIKQGADFPFAHQVFGLFIGAAVLHQLPDFFLERHLLDQRIDALFGCGIA